MFLLKGDRPLSLADPGLSALTAEVSVIKAYYIGLCKVCARFLALPLRVGYLVIKGPQIVGIRPWVLGVEVFSQPFKVPFIKFTCSTLRRTHGLWFGFGTVKGFSDF